MASFTQRLLKVVTSAIIFAIVGTGSAFRVRPNQYLQVAHGQSSNKSSTWCVALSGNGGNWASTLGFISEALLLYVKEFSNAKIDLRCAVGGSSGAATTILLRSLLANEKFGVSSDGLATPEQARMIAYALSLLAQITDLDTVDIVQTLKSVARTKLERWGASAWDKSALAIDVPATMLQFRHAIELARHMSPHLCQLPVVKMIRDHKGIFKDCREQNPKLTIVAALAAAGLAVAAGVYAFRKCASDATPIADVSNEELGGRGLLDSLGKVLEAMKAKMAGNPKLALAAALVAFAATAVLIIAGVALSRKFFPNAKDWCERENLIDVAKDCGLRYAADLPSCNSLKTLVLQKQVTLIMKDISYHMLRLTKQEMKEQMKKVGCASRQRNGINVESNNKMTVLDKVLSEEPEDGFIAVTFAHKRTGLAESVKGVAYSSAHILALMSEGTAKSILRSQSYRQAIMACREKDVDVNKCQFADRFILATVKTMRPMITLPTMEPGMVKPFVAPLSSMGVTSAFDPRAAQPDSQMSWSLESTKKVDPIDLILGGFVDRGQSVMLQQFYTDGKNQEDVRFAVFGKDTDPQTAVNAVVQVLSDETAGNFGEVNWADYTAWSKLRPPGTFLDGRLNWDCGASIPANIRGASWQLRLHGAARARAAHAGNKKPDIFDPMETCEDPSSKPDDAQGTLAAEGEQLEIMEKESGQQRGSLVELLETAEETDGASR